MKTIAEKIHEYFLGLMLEHDVVVTTTGSDTIKSYIQSTLDDGQKTVDKLTQRIEELEKEVHILELQHKDMVQKKRNTSERLSKKYSENKVLQVSHDKLVKALEEIEAFYDDYDFAKDASRKALDSIKQMKGTNNDI